VTGLKSHPEKRQTRQRTEKCIQWTSKLNTHSQDKVLKHGVNCLVVQPQPKPKPKP